MYKHKDLPNYKHPDQFTVDNIRYPQTWWDSATAEQIKDLGFIKIKTTRKNKSNGQK